jgi:Uma2 family endonuclease
MRGMGSEQAIGELEDARRHLLTVDEFLALDEAGFFEPLGTVELVEGEIFVLSPLYIPHAKVTFELGFAIKLALRALGSDLIVLSPVSAMMNDKSLPQPDIVVGADQGGKWMTPEAARLFVEVSQSTLRHDLQRKAALYARTGVPEYWVADLTGRRIVQMHAPGEEGYAMRQEFAFGEVVPSATIDGLVVDTAAFA